MSRPVDELVERAKQGQQSEQLGYDIDDQNDERGQRETSEPCDDPTGSAAYAEAGWFGVLGTPFSGCSEPACRWVSGEAMEQLSETMQGLVCERDGWTPDSWARYLQYRAGRCDDQECFPTHSS